MRIQHILFNKLFTNGRNMEWEMYHGWFLSDPGPIIVYPSQWLTDSLTDSLTD